MRGTSYANPALVTYFMKNRAGICRIGITTSKKIGNAVERNKSRRLIRAAFQNVYKEYGGVRLRIRCTRADQVQEKL